MDYLHFSPLDRRVSRICLGTGHFGSRFSADTCGRLLDAYAEAGGNFLDTAHVYGAWAPDGFNGGYGNSEAVIGRWMERTGCRKDMIIGTKGAHPDFATGASTFSHRILERQLQQSLEHLRTDYIDIYYLHRDDRSVPVREILGWYKEPVEKGIIRTLGVSHWRTDRITEALALADGHGLPRITVSQLAMSLARPNATVTSDVYGEQLAMDDELSAFHTATGLPLAAFSSQAQGFFSAQFDGATFREPDFPKPGLIEKYANSRNLANRAIAADLARAKGCTTNQVALAWLLSQPFPVYAITGPRTAGQLTDSLQAADIHLSAAEFNRFIS